MVLYVLMPVSVESNDTIEHIFSFKVSWHSCMAMQITVGSFSVSCWYTVIFLNFFGGNQNCSP